MNIGLLIGVILSAGTLPALLQQPDEIGLFVDEFGEPMVDEFGNPMIDSSGE